MSIYILENHPQYYSSTLELIERSFNYNKANLFEIDFAPLVQRENWKNCYIKIENEKIIAHVGVYETKISGLPVAMIGGIAVDESRRGEGIFQEIFQEVLSDKREDFAFFLLWSDKEKLYRRFGFHLCGSQFEAPKGQPDLALNFKKTKLHQVSKDDLAQIKYLYQNSFSKQYLTIERSDEDWNLLTKITSADLFIKREDEKIQSYFFMNKGQDLEGIIYEYGSILPIPQLLPQLNSYGKVWSPIGFNSDAEAQYQFMLAPANKKLFSEFINIISNKMINIRDINQIKQEIYFEFNQELMAIEIEEFLRGVLGPGLFEELGNGLRPIFISGLSSI